MSTTLTGAAASSGVAIGPAFHYSPDTNEPLPEFDDPRAAFLAAAEATAGELRDLRAAATEAGRTEAADVMGAQAAMAEDPMMVSEVETRLDGGMGLDAATIEVSDQLSAMLASLDDPYLAARSRDVVEVMSRVRTHLSGKERVTLDFATPMIIVTEELTAADTVNLNPDFVLGFVTAKGGPTGHVAVIARSLGIPAVVGVAGLAGVTASIIALNGSTGEVVADPDEETQQRFQAVIENEAKQHEADSAYHGKAVLFDGRQVRVAANVGGPADVEASKNADGIGLYRTEFLFLDRDRPPTEDEQYETYSAAAAAFAHPVVVRTFDIGGDKPAAYLQIEPEENPFLGMRGVRLYESQAVLFSTQLRALLRAAVHGDLWVMIPMVATVQEVVIVRQALAKAQESLVDEGIEFGTVKLGIMIEVPSAALSANQLARHADFFSIGTNDLTQYTMATDRTSGSLAAYSDAAHPAVIRLCDIAAQAAREAGISISLCGSAAGDPITAALYLAMGMDKLSVPAPSVNSIRSLVDRLDPGLARQALEESLQAD
jgi:phosphoenolpyruvate-protein phosphotransferase